MAKQVHIHIHRNKTRDAGEGEGKGRWITLSPSGTHVKVDGNGEITAGPKGMAGKKPSELSNKTSRPERTPMQQENRKLEAQQLKEARRLERTPAQPGMERTINRLQAKSDLEQAKERIYAKRATARGLTGPNQPSFGKPEGGAPLKGSAGPATTKTESYSWGKLTKVGNVNESAIAHPKDREQIAALADGDSYQYTDEQGKQWKVTRHGEQAAFYKANEAKPALVAPLGEFQDTPHDPTGMAHAGRPQGTAAVQARIDAKKAAGAPEKPAAQKYSSKLASLNRLLNNAPSGSEQAKHIQSQIRATQLAQAKTTQAAKAAGKPAVNASSLKEGQALYDKSGQKVDEVESIQKRSLGKGLTINTRAGYQVHVDENGTNSQGWSNEKPGASGDAPTSQNQKIAAEMSKDPKALRQMASTAESQGLRERAAKLRQAADLFEQDAEHQRRMASPPSIPLDTKRTDWKQR